MVHVEYQAGTRIRAATLTPAVHRYRLQRYRLQTPVPLWADVDFFIKLEAPVEQRDPRACETCMSLF